MYEKFGEDHKKAATLHNLGRVAQELREYLQAKKYYQRAINLTHNDIFLKASTYGQLGMLAEELLDWESAKSNYLEALKIFAQSEDAINLNLTISNLTNLYQKTQDNSLIKEAAVMLKMTEAEVKELFDQPTTNKKE